MRAVEADAGRRFARVGLETIANGGGPPSASILAGRIARSAIWAAVTADGTVVGYAVASVVDGDGHLDQVSVVEAAAGHGVGRALIDQVIEWTVAAGYPALTLTTFRDIPWNGPDYERLGFVPLHPAEIGPELAVIQAEHTAAGDRRHPPHRHAPSSKR